MQHGGGQGARIVIIQEVVYVHDRCTGTVCWRSRKQSLARVSISYPQLPHVFEQVYSAGRPPDNFESLV
ncbi:Uncharacterized protein APZ42_024369 [Daphnia magna]|uniref:Uncharacterized protein n=1 Tax=Daphnia magna TaxID=35525 RepID=A0A164U341_9CRUS|nr:Uncharacterized protein APZ42_024369 [Daphnia magna]